MQRRRFFLFIVLISGVVIFGLWYWTTNRSPRTQLLDVQNTVKQLPPTDVEVVKLSTNNSVSISSGSKFKDLLKKRSSPVGSVIILAYVDLPFIDMALNFYETSLKRFGLQNYLFAASDSACCDAFKGIDAEACYVYKKDEASLKASEYGSKDFLRKMNIRTDMILEALAAGVTVLHSDTDIYFAKNPLEHIDCSNCDLATLMDTSDYNAGFLLIRPTARSSEVYTKMKAMSIKQPNVDDQDQLTKTIGNMQRNKDFIVKKLPTDKFLCGLYYFENGHRNFAGDNECAECVVIHNNWIVSREAKVYRFKEMLMWDYDANHYYTSTTNRYLTYENPVIFDDLQSTKENERNALKNALALGQILNRIVILPAFHCENKKESKCALNSHFRLTSFDKIFGNMYREHVFLRHPKVPAVIKDSISIPYFIENDLSIQHTALMQALPSDAKGFTPSSTKNGATDNEIVVWLKNQTDAVLRFHSLYGAFYKFESSEQQTDFDNRIKNGLAQAGYRQF